MVQPGFGALMMQVGRCILL